MQASELSRQALGYTGPGGRPEAVTLPHLLGCDHLPALTIWNPKTCYADWCERRVFASVLRPQSFVACLPLDATAQYRSNGNSGSPFCGVLVPRHEFISKNGSAGKSHISRNSGQRAASRCSTRAKFAALHVSRVRNRARVGRKCPTWKRAPQASLFQPVRPGPICRRLTANEILRLGVAVTAGGSNCKRELV